MLHITTATSEELITTLDHKDLKNDCTGEILDIGGREYM